MALGKKIRALREELGMSQALLASCAGLSQGYLSQLENNDVQNPSAAVIFRVSEALHVDPRLLMQAAGYEDVNGDANGGDSFEVSVDPDLLRFLAGMTREQQEHLLRFLQGMESRQAVEAGKRR